MPSLSFTILKPYTNGCIKYPNVLPFETRSRIFWSRHNARQGDLNLLPYSNRFITKLNEYKNGMTLQKTCVILGERICWIEILFMLYTIIMIHLYIPRIQPVSIDSTGLGSIQSTVIGILFKCVFRLHFAEVFRPYLNIFITCSFWALKQFIFFVQF